MMYSEENFLSAKKEEVYEKVPIYLWTDWIEHASEEDRNDVGFMRKLVAHRGECLRLAPDVLKSDRKIVMNAIKDFDYAIVFASEELQNDREFVKQALQARPGVIQYVKERFKNDRELALIVVRKYGAYIEDLSEELQRDPKVINAALGQNMANLRYMSELVRDNREVVLQAVSQSGHMLEYVSDRLRADKEVVLAAVPSAWNALSFALGGLNKDRDVVLAAVQGSGSALQFASEELKDDREIVLAAVENHGAAYSYASDALHDDKELALLALKNCDYAFYSVSERLKRDRDVIAAALRISPQLFEVLPEELQTDPEIILFALETIAGNMPDSDNYSFFGDGTSEYYDAFKDAEEVFLDVAAKIPADRMKSDPALTEKLCALAITATEAYDDEADDPHGEDHDRLIFRFKGYLDEKGITASPALEEAVAAAEAELFHLNPYDELEPEERLLHQNADWYDWYVDKMVREFGAESYREYLSPGGNYVRFCMVSFVKDLARSWPGLFHDYERWKDRDYEVDLDLVYEEIKGRLASKMEVKRAAYEYYYSEYVGIAVNGDIFFRLVRSAPLRILDLWVNQFDSEHEHGIWVAPDRLDRFCEMAEYVHDNYGRFSEMAEERAAKLREKYGLRV